MLIDNYWGKNTKKCLGIKTQSKRESKPCGYLWEEHSRQR